MSDLTQVFNSISIEKKSLPSILIENETSLFGLLKSLLTDIGVTEAVTDPASFIAQGYT